MLQILCGKPYATLFAYDAVGRVTQETRPDTDADPNNNPKYLYQYDLAGNYTVYTDPLNHATTLAYDNLNRAISVTNALNQTTTLAYDAAGNLTTVTDPLNRITRLGYDTANRQTSLTNPLMQPTNYTLDKAGQVTAVIDALNRTTTYTYNVRGWVTTVLDPLSNQTQTGYNASGDPTSVAESGPGYTPTTTNSSFDALHRLTQVQDQLSHQTTRAFDAAGNLLSVTDALGHTTSFTYDARDRLLTETNALSQVVARYTYDPAGNQLTMQDGLNRTTSYAYDAQDRATTVTSTLNGQTRFAYDLADRRTSITDPVNNVTGYTYDNADRLTITTDPLGRNTTNAFDAAGQLTSVTDRNGRVRTFGYDLAGRRITENWLNSMGQPIRIISHTYNAVGLLTAASDPDSSYAYTYDARNRLTTVNNQGTPGVPNVILTYGYDPFDNRISLQDNLGGSIQYTHDFAKRLTSIRFLGGQSPTINLTYDNADRLTNISRFVVSTSQVNSVLSYDNADRLTNITHSGPGGTLSTFSYTRNAASEVSSYTGPEGTLNYAYDLTGQLTGVSGARVETYSYDLNGNRTLAGYSTGTGNRLLSDGTYNYTYDNEGNTLTKIRISDGQRTEFTWDYRNRLTNVVVKTSGGTVLQEDRFTYDVVDRRIGKWLDPDGAGPLTATQTWTVYDGVNTYADFDGSGALTNRYLYGDAIDFLLARLTSTGTPTWYLADLLGSVRQLTDTSGAVLDQLTYDSFGNLVLETNPANGDRFKYTSRELDAEINQYFYRARHYTPSAGRFLSEDSMQFDAGDPNFYRYAANAPTWWSDPTGHFAFNWEAAGTACAYGAVAGAAALAPSVVGMVGGAAGGCVLGGLWAGLQYANVEKLTPQQQTEVALGGLLSGVVMVKGGQFLWWVEQRITLWWTAGAGTAATAERMRTAQRAAETAAPNNPNAYVIPEKLADAYRWRRIIVDMLKETEPGSYQWNILLRQLKIIDDRINNFPR